MLPRLKENLLLIRSSAAGKTYQWQIPLNSPLMTVDSRGEYERDEGGVHTVFAKIASVWQIEPLGPHNSGSLQHRKFALSGIASTRIYLFERLQGGGERELAMWRMGIGDEQSPGCHFHVQVLGTNPKPPFPQTLSVPRLPFHFATPAVAFESPLGEIFQDRWKSQAAGSLRSADWGALQRERLLKLLEWQRLVVDSAIGSPWLALKTGKPKSDLFT